MGGVHLFLNGDRGLAVAEALRDAGEPIVFVHVPAAKAQGTPLARRLAELGLRVWGVEDVNAPAFLAELAATAPEVLVVAGYSSIFKAELLAVPRLGVLNLHGGRLPQYRGGSPLNWQIISGESAAGISVIRMDTGIDTGPVLAAGEVPIGAEDTILDVHDRANACFPGLVLAAIAALRRGETGVVQDEGLAAYWHQRNDADGRLRFDRMTARQGHDLIRAVTHPYNGAFCWWNGRQVRIWRSRLLDGAPVRGVPGRVFFLQGLGPLVLFRDTALVLLDWRIEGEKGRLPAGIHLD
jgi:methionyl-tRNA formyltransferase